MHRSISSQLREALRRYLIAGILVFAPLGVTIGLLLWVFQKLDSLLLRWIFPNAELPYRIPLIGVVFTLLFILLLGIIARHLFGTELVRLSERLLKRVPVASNVYSAVKQLVEAIFRARGRSAFQQVVLIEYPRKGCWAIAFTTGTPKGAVADAIAEDMLNCFVPTTPNPTSGFYLLVPQNEVRELDLSVEDAFKMVMSGGLVAPDRASGSSEAGPDDAAGNEGPTLAAGAAATSSGEVR